MNPLLPGSADVQVYHGDGLAWSEEVDALITDAPYSERTHAGCLGSGGNYDGADRHRVNYTAWSPNDVRRAVSAWAPLVRGWFVTITDHILAPVWADSLTALGRYVFAPLPAVILGGGVRLSGDGPSSTTRWIVVARPRHEPYSKWGTLPGHYIGPREQMDVVGGKPLWLMRCLVEDYTRPGCVVVDPCCGAGTTIVAARLLGRRGIGIEIDAGRAALAAERINKTVQLPLFASAGPTTVQCELP